MISFTENECDSIISLSNTLEKTRRDDYSGSIKYTFYSIGRNSDTSWIFDRLDSYLSETLGIKVIKQLDAIHLFDYKKGDSFSRHRDIYYENQIHNIGVCLNDDYEGGDFVFNDNHTLKFNAGDILIFPSTFMYAHEVKAITKGTRYSFVSWGF